VWADSHCHLTFEGREGSGPNVSGQTVQASGPSSIEEARAAGVTRLITIGTDAAESAAAIALAHAHRGVWATVGLHPHDAVRGVDSIAALLDRSDPVVVGVGECGLDYYYDHSPRPVQRQAFAAQVQLAADLDLTLVVHTREAWDDTFEILAGTGVPARWVLHCFSGGPTEAARGLEMGAMLSFSGIVTFKSAEDVRAAAAACPLDRLLVETDSPYLAPVPYRGQRNRPALVPVVGAAVAAVRGQPPEAVEDATWANTAAVFGLTGSAAEAAGAGG
jgi:TatD DNase family protein